jgi:hypothetical protein
MVRWPVRGGKADARPRGALVVGLRPVADSGGRRHPLPMSHPPASPYPCPCCGHRTLAARAAFEICPVCYWEDDGQDDDHADEVWGGPNRELSLALARMNYARIGAADPRDLAHVRRPSKEEAAR